MATGTYLQCGRIQWYKYLQKPRKRRLLAQKAYSGNDVKFAHSPPMKKVKKHEKIVS